METEPFILLDDEEEEEDQQCCFKLFRRRRRRRNKVSTTSQFEVMRRLTQVKQTLRHKVDINEAKRREAIECAKKARAEGKEDEAIFHMKRAKSIQAVNKRHLKMLLNMEVHAIELENDPSSIANALDALNELPSPPITTKVMVHESPPPPTKTEKKQLLL